MYRYKRTALAVVVAFSPLLLPTAALGQTAGGEEHGALPWAEAVPGDERPSLAVAEVRADFDLANAVYEEDRDLAARADALLREELAKHARLTLLDRKDVQAAVPEGSEGRCADAACALAIGKATEADYVLTATLHKISNLVWLVNGEVFDPSTGRVLAAETLEMKGAPAEMVPQGIAVLARRLSLGR